ncbi:MAG: hypothetical protein KBT06_06170 [Prevotellaceae bacterium]|nr:hypothetical protein [Candidatus Colivivens equi]
MANDASLSSIDELVEFENALRKYKESLVQCTNDATRSMNTVNQAWNDKVQQEFMQRFIDALKGIKEMAQLIDEHQRYVHKKSEDLKAYLGR